MERDDATRQRAYEIWLDEGQPDGKHEEHWLRAEKDLAAAHDSGAEASTKAGKAPGTPPPGLENTLA